MNLFAYISKYKNLRQSTLCFLVNDKNVLLAMKKRGFGVGRWNGVGGKVNQDESVEEAAKRETKEEIGVICQDILKMAVLDFYFEGDDNLNQQVIVYTVNKWEGEPEESEEMSPKWFEKNNLPFEAMWGDDEFWLPDILSGKKVKASFLFGKGDILLEKSVKTVDLLD